MSRRPTRQELVEKLAPILVLIQARLDEDLRLSNLAAKATLSPTHFHRLFHQLTRETPKQYCQRLRLERAALRLLLSRRTIHDLALECGFNRHETFSRAFRKRFGVSPRQYRLARRETRREGETTAQGVGELVTRCELSSTRVDEFEALPVAFIRQIGPYEEADPEAWNQLTQWADARGWVGPRILLGIAQDAPTITPTDKLRFDSAIRAPGPFEADGDVAFQVVPGGLYGITTHVGPYSTLEQAYRATFERLSTLRRYRIVGLPSVEIYHTTRISVDYELNQTDVCIPLTLR